MAQKKKRAKNKRTKQSTALVAGKNPAKLAVGRSTLIRILRKRTGQAASQPQPETSKQQAEHPSSTTQKPHRFAQMKTTSNKLHNILDFSVAFAVYSGRVDLLRLESDRLRWVAEAGPSAGLPLRSIIESHVVPAFNSERLSPNEIGEAIQQASKQIRGHLEREFDIFCDVRLRFVLEEQEKEALGRFAEGMRIENAEEAFKSLRRACEPGRLDFVDINEISLKKAGKITEANFELEDLEVKVLPGNEICFVLVSKEPVICREFQLFCREHQVLRHRMPVHFDANSRRTIRLPGIPVAMYRHLLWEQSGELCVHLVVEGRNEVLVLPQRLRHQHLEINKVPVALFLDIGSAYSKFMVVEIAADLTDTDIDQAELATRLSSALECGLDGSAEHISLEVPQVTQVFADNYGLSHAPKKTLDEYDDERLAAHFAGSISGIAARFYKRENRLVSDVYWAFPNTQERDFVKITKQVNRSLGGTTMGAVTIVPESDCLRSEFAGVLNALADAAKRATQKVRDAGEAKKRIRKAWEGYHSRPWYEKAWIKVTGGKPVDPSQSALSIPSLEDWQSEFSRLDCDEQLSDFLVFDAGGYSLDVYGTFSDGANEIISQSFKAGSSKINTILTAHLRKNNPGRSDQEYAATAEEVKRTVCSDPSQNEGHELFQFCEAATRKVYEKPIQSTLQTIKHRCNGKGFPIILTGGGSLNQFLHKLVESELSSMDMKTVSINSPLLYSTLKRSRGTQSSELKLFLCMASAFNPTEDFPRMASTTDILGGLAHLAHRSRA